MAQVINTNTMSLNAQRNLSTSGSSLATTIQRLSSGLRINSAKDDAAGLAISERFTTQIRGLDVAIRNANDGLSLASIADNAMEEISSTLERMAELATQSTNGVYTTSQRSAMQTEFLALGSEIERIAATTTYNQVQLLSGSSQLSIQVGFNSSANSTISIANVLGTLNSLGLSGSGSSALTYSLTGTTVYAAQTASQLALDAVNAAISSISSRRGVMGAAESRLSVAIENLTVLREDLVSAESRIRDVDVAQEVAEMVRLQVLQQAGTAVLAQANQQPAIAYALLQGA